MAEEEGGQEKTEEPTGRRLTQSRSEGMVAKSYDLSSTIGMISAFVALQYIGPKLWNDLLIVFHEALAGGYAYENFSVGMLQYNFLGLLWIFAPHVLLLMVIAAFFGAGSTALQTKFLWSSKLLKPRFNMINPLAGLKRMFSVGNLVNLLKSVAKLILIGPIAYFAFLEIFPKLLTLVDVPMTNLMPVTHEMMSLLFWRIVKILMLLGVIDYAWQWWSTKKRLKMSKQEVKEERKATEGDESTKMAIRSKGFERIRKAMLENVRRADVVVTSPTHLAVALRYVAEPGVAPIVVAKGRGHLAARIRELARQSGIPVVERKPLARALFKAVEVGQQIPYELYAAVAEVLAYVYRLKGRNPLQGRKPSASSRPETRM